MSAMVCAAIGHVMQRGGAIRYEIYIFSFPVIAQTAKEIMDELNEYKSKYLCANTG